MHSVTKTWLIRGGSFVLAGVLLYLALRGVDFRSVGEALSRANYLWIFPIVAITMLSHGLRAARWVILLQVSPRREPSQNKISFVNTFLSLMIGYMANYAGPRLGEVIRTGNVARKENMYFSTVLGTVVVERVLDMVTFAVALLALPLIFSDQMAGLSSLLWNPVSSWLAARSPIMIGSVVALLVLGAAISLRILLEGLKSPSSKLGGLLDHFRSGFVSLSRTGKPWSIFFLTASMWFCYALMAYFPFVMLNLTDVFGISLLGATGLMLIGAIGVIIPSPGGIGTYHFVTIQSLSLLFAMPNSEAATYALLTHTGQMLLYVIVGFAGMLFLGATVSAKETQERGDE